LKKKILQSANFKRDYVAASAIIIFILIVVSELALAVAIPSYLYRENSMALQVRRLKLLESFDGARHYCNILKPRSTAAEMEQRLIFWDLDRLAVYLRTESRNLSSEEIAHLQNAVNDIWTVLNVLGRGGSYSNETVIDTRTYVNSLIPKVGVRKNEKK